MATHPSFAEKGEPLKFAGREILVRFLGSRVVADGVEDFLSRRRLSMPDVVRTSVERSTIRAIHTFASHGVPPLACYREWAHGYFGDERVVAAFTGATDAAAHLAALDRAVESLREHFTVLTSGGYVFTYGRAAKLINLTVKHLALYERIDPPAGRALFARSHVALDRFTLAPIAWLETGFGLGQPPSMGDVESRESYLAIQRWIGDACAQAGVPAIWYEVATFNLPQGLWNGSPPASASEPLPRGIERLPGASKGRPYKGARATLNNRVQAEKVSKRKVRSIPRPDKWASVAGHRQVTNALVAHVRGASHRNASFDGVIELAGSEDARIARSGIGSRSVRARLTWFGQARKNGFVTVGIDGPCLVEENFTGSVIDQLGELLA